MRMTQTRERAVADVPLLNLDRQPRDVALVLISLFHKSVGAFAPCRHGQTTVKNGQFHVLVELVLPLRIGRSERTQKGSVSCEHGFHHFLSSGGAVLQVARVSRDAQS